MSRGVSMSGSNGFDPSREWLGIAAVDLADPFRALGLSATEADAAAVTAAAERLLGRLRSVDPGPFRLAHDSLHRRIAACRTEALAAIAARPPVASPAPFAASPAAPGWVPLPPPVPTPPLVPSGLADTVEEDPVIRLRRPGRRRSDASGAMAAILSALVAAAAVGAAYALWPQAGTGGVKLPRPIAAVLPRPAAREPSPVAPPRPMNPPPPRPIDPAPVAPPQPAADAPAPPATPVETNERANPPAPAAPPQPANPAPPSTPMPAPAPPQEPVPVPAPPQPTPEQLARRAADVDQALREAHAALQRGEYDTAERRIAAADRLAEDDERLADRVTCWRQLALYARQFPDYRDEAMKVAGGDYDVGRTRISVIESTPTIFKYKSAGTIKRIPPADVPRPIVNAIVRAWFAAKDQPGNHVFLGCDLVLLDTPNVEGARQEWAIAKRGGENVAFLEPLLDDPIIRDAARQ